MKGIFDLLQMNRYRLLYFLVSSRGSIRDDPGVKAKLRDLFDYKSDGHFYTDWDFLIDNKLLEVKDGFIIATKDARREFSFLTWLLIMTAMSIAVAVALVFYEISLAFHLSFFGIAVNNEGIILVSIAALVLLGVFSGLIYRDFAPVMPPKQKIKDSRL